MSKKLYGLTVRGNQDEWLFEAYLDPKYVDDPRADGIEIFEIENTVPEWIASYGLTRPWCFFQDLFHFRNPFRR